MKTSNPNEDRNSVCWRPQLGCLIKQVFVEVKVFNEDLFEPSDAMDGYLIFSIKLDDIHT